MTTEVINSVPRSLLERILDVMDNYVTHETAEEDQLRALLAQPAAQVTEEVRVLRAALERDAGYRDGLAAGFNFGVADDLAGYQRSLSHYTQAVRDGRAALAAKAGEVGK